VNWLKRQYWLVTILRMDIVDTDYLSALAGRRFRSKRAAVSYYLRNESDRARSLSLSPLIESEWISLALPNSDASPYAALRRTDQLFSTAPVFDAKSYASSLRGRYRAWNTATAMRYFLRHSAETTIMPVDARFEGTAPTWGLTRSAAIERARNYASQVSLRRTRSTPGWDVRAERNFVDRLAEPASLTNAPQLVTVIMPTRNREQQLAAAIESVQAQTYPHWQLIVIDDGSRDGTSDYLTELCARDGRIIALTTPSLGAAVARNRGVAAASGDIIAFLDSDNTWLPHFLEYSLAGMAQQGSNAVYCGMRVHRDGGEVRYRGFAGGRNDLLAAGNFVDLNSLVLTKSLFERVGGFDPAIRRWMDYDLILAISAYEPFVYLPFLGVDYDDRRAPDRVTAMESPGWDDVVLGKHLVDWAALAGGTHDRKPGAVTVVIPTYGDWRLTAASVRSVLKAAGRKPDSIIVIDNGSRRPVSSILAMLFQTETTVRVLRMARNLNFALANNYAVSLSTTEYIVTLNNDTEVSDGWLEPLITPLAGDPSILGTQPLLLYPDGTIQTAGTVFLGEGQLPRHFLAAHPVSDIAGVSDDSYAAITAAAMCVRAEDFIALHGFDPLYTNGLEDVDFCLRARASREGVFRVIAESVVHHHEGATPDRRLAARRNRALFHERWDDAYPPTDGWRYAALGAVTPENAPPND
jgi:GT2 family glycosyltransferase